MAIVAIPGGQARTAYSYRQDPEVPDFPDEGPVFLFDGLCALCSGWASLILRYDRRQRFRLIPAQSPLGQALYRHYGCDPVNFETNMLIETGRVWFKSEACRRVALELDAPVMLLGFALTLTCFLPLSWRDRAYDQLARRRLGFGRREVCFMGTDEQRDRFLV